MKDRRCSHIIILRPLLHATNHLRHLANPPDARDHFLKTCPHHLVEKRRDVLACLTHFEKQKTLDVCVWTSIMKLDSVVFLYISLQKGCQFLQIHRGQLVNFYRNALVQGFSMREEIWEHNRVSRCRWELKTRWITPWCPRSTQGPPPGSPFIQIIKISWSKFTFTSLSILS